MSEYFGGKILRIDLASATPVIEIFISGLVSPQDLFIRDNYLYVGEFNSGRVSRIDILSPNPTPIFVSDGLDSVSGIVIHEDYLYISDQALSKIVRIDLTVSDPTQEVIVEDLAGVNGGMIIQNNELYFFQNISNEFSKIDITVEDPEIISLDTGIDGGELIMIGTDVYVTDYNNGNLLVYNDFFPLGVNEFYNNEITLSPNPSSTNITINGLPEPTPYVIYDQLGSKVMEGMTSFESNIDIEVLSSGIYIVKLDHTNSIQFIKN